MAQHVLPESASPTAVAAAGKPEAACPICGASIEKTPVLVQTLTVCPVCARTLAFERGRYRAARADDVFRLSALEQRDLRKLRPSAWRDNVKARLSEIRGKVSR